MASIRFQDPNDPYILVYLGRRNLLKSDIEFIEEKEQHVTTIVREATRIYCDAWRTSQYLPAMTSEERIAFIRCKIPCMQMLHTRPDRGNYAKMMDCPTIPTRVHNIVKKLPGPDMRGWSKAQRDVYILYGTPL